MHDMCSMTIVRNGADYLEPCILQIVDKVSTVKITIDSRSTDNTRDIAYKLSTEYPNVKVKEFKVEDPLTGLVAMRNSQLKFAETWGFIVDSDEFHYDINQYRLEETEEYAYALQCHAPWTKFGQAHKASGRAIIGRIFRNKGDLEWKGTFGKEKLYRGHREVFQNATLLPNRYLHFTHLKKDDWRSELRQKRVADGRSLYQLDSRLIRIIRNIHAEMGMSSVPGWN